VYEKPNIMRFVKVISRYHIAHPSERYYYGMVVGTGSAGIALLTGGTAASDCMPNSAGKKG
jgi:hypothetical protein